MTFRARLRLFFAIIVVVPLVAAGAALWLLVAASEDGKADARIATALRVGGSSYKDGRRQAAAQLVRLGRDQRLTAALAAGDRPAAAARLRRLASDRPESWRS